MNLADMVASRKAALLVHSLPGGTRQQVLDRLIATERAKLEHLLDELKALSIPVNGNWSELLASETVLTGHTPSDINALSTAAVARAIADQPLEIVAALLKGSHWSWATGLTQGMSALDSAKLNRCLRDQRPVSAQVKQHLLEHLLAAAKAKPRSPS